MALQSSQRLPELLFYTKKSYKILQAPIPTPIPILHVHITLHYTTIQRILHLEYNSTCRRQRALRVLLLHYRGQRDLHSRFQKRSFTHRRQGDLLEIHPCVLQDIPDIPVIHDLPAFPGNSTNSTSSSIFRESNPFQHSPIRMHILQFDWFPENSTKYQLSNYKHYKHSFFKEREMLRYRSN